MKRKPTSRVTLSPKDLALVRKIQRQLKIKSKFEVIRQGIIKLKDELDLELLMIEFKSASKVVLSAAEAKKVRKCSKPYS